MILLMRERETIEYVFRIIFSKNNYINCFYFFLFIKVLFFFTVKREQIFVLSLYSLILYTRM